ncbi:GNAT family N-acetyltransferase [Thermus sp.]|uniref:GNAT family N-acetyltransferase n=1 Tax=Thermus sp. TaxID=275 RepID=UPI00298EE663|nr:GNAT family N-acetyltransferase [Thermus sp.]MDW8358600.1 GNAT family N-acetyltransferase [Thermus sp.]
MVEIRPLTQEDLPEVAGLLQLLDPQGGDLEALLQAWKALTACPWGQAFVAVREGKVVGTYTLYVLPNLGHGGRPFAVMESVAVAQEAQGQGIGTQMVRHALEEARRLGAYKLALSSALHRKGAHRFYKRLGFRVHGLSLGVHPL